MSSIESICICGAGSRGTAVAQVIAAAGFHTILYDVIAGNLEKAKSILPWNIRFTTDMNDCIADLFIEAIVENANVKAALFNQLNEFNHSEVIFVTSTASLSVSTIAKTVMNPQRLAGLHFFNSAAAGKLAEVVAGNQSSDDTIASLLLLVKQLDKLPVLCEDMAGHCKFTPAQAYYDEVLRLLKSGEADVNTVDALLITNGFSDGTFVLKDLVEEF